MKHIIEYREKDQFVFMRFDGDLILADVEDIKERAGIELKKSPYMQILLEMTSEKVENRQTRIEVTKALRDLQVKQIVFIGGSAVNRMIARVLLKTGIMKLEGDIFSDYDKAVTWLKGKR